MNLLERLRRWLDKKGLEVELHAYDHFQDREGAKEVLREMQEKGYFDD